MVTIDLLDKTVSEARHDAADVDLLFPTASSVDLLSGRLEFVQHELDGGIESVTQDTSRS